MTLEECKHELACKAGYPNWKEWEKVNFGLIAVAPGSYPYNELSELYASQYKELNAELLKCLKVGLRYTSELSEVYNESTELSASIKEEVHNSIKSIKSLITKAEQSNLV